MPLIKWPTQSAIIYRGDFIFTTIFEVDSLGSSWRSRSVLSHYWHWIFLCVFFLYQVCSSHERSSLLEKAFSLRSIIFVTVFEGDSCGTHDGKAGVCIELPSCATLIQLYRANPSKQTIDILLANQKNCGNRKVGRNPLMCCSDGVTQPTQPPPPSALSGPPCSTPDGYNGFCIGECSVNINSLTSKKFLCRREAMSISAGNFRSTSEGSRIHQIHSPVQRQLQLRFAGRLLSPRCSTSRSDYSHEWNPNRTTEFWNRSETAAAFGMRLVESCTQPSCWWSSG